MNTHGTIEVICGSMFAGKTHELIRRLRLAIIARQKVQIFKHSLDVRYAHREVVSHDQIKIPSKPVSNVGEILASVDQSAVIGIDEAQFFDVMLIDACQQLANEGRRVIVAGLDLDYTGKPFPTMAGLMAVAEYVTKNLAICMICSGSAGRTKRISSDPDPVGHFNKYEARCRKCFNVENQMEKENGPEMHNG